MPSSTNHNSAMSSDEITNTFYKVMQKLFPKCLKHSVSLKSVNFVEENDAIKAQNQNQKYGQQKKQNFVQKLEYSEAELSDFMDEIENQKASIKLKNSAALDFLSFPRHHCFDLVIAAPYSIYSIPRNDEFFKQVISKFTRYPLDKIIIVRRFHSFEDNSLMALDCKFDSAIMILYNDHPLIKPIAQNLIKSAKLAEYRWMNLREIKIVEDFCS